MSLTNKVPKIEIHRSTDLQSQPATENLGFGKHFTDHMFLAHYHTDKGWYKAEVKPISSLDLHPASCVLHYGQALFEGMKAFRQPDNSVALFRTHFNWKRLCEGAKRLCMQAPPAELFHQGIQELVKLDQAWVPHQDDSSLYIRPTLIGTENFLGIRPSKEYLFFVILSPVGPYYSEGINPVKIWVEENYLRAAPGGLGQTKAAANYAGSLRASENARANGYTQVLWLDINREYIEEVGTMNIFFVIDDEVITPSLDGTILGGGVRDSAIKLLLERGLKVSEKKVAIHDLVQAHQNGSLKEVFGTGTAAVISPVGELNYKGKKLIINEHKIGPIAHQLYKELTDIQYGRAKDPFGWLEPL